MGGNVGCLFVCGFFFLIWTGISNEVLVLLPLRLEKMYYKTKQNKTKQPKAGSNNTANSTIKVICTCKLVLRLFHCSFFSRWLSTVCMLRDRRFSEFYNFPADLIIQVREENVSISFTSIL